MGEVFAGVVAWFQDPASWQGEEGLWNRLTEHLLLTGTAAIVISATLALGALFIVGALVSLLTGRSLLFSGLRQCAIGGGTALVTYIVGSLIGVNVG